MGREFITLFDDWAATYDQSVTGNDPQYKAVFANYEGILDEVVHYSTGVILEFGVGTGNLSGKLMDAGHHVIGIEPSAAMRKIATEKFPELLLLAGDFITFPKLPSTVETIVSTYAFHHLTDDEKGQAIKKFADLLPDNGKVVFADTMFQSESVKQALMKKAADRGFDDLVVDLKTEYYPKVNVMRHLFEINNFQVTFKQMNEFVWLIVAEKDKTQK
ncbi:putative AdoMet-dependent methyltransferase [Virgibacillus halotolerans]|uniref:class I SAM-dependent DNA methyltransferase n=1 Tax=Virgibacillus halotolerans TaxID=1071053 RepID=UPI0019612E22|nr:class I SAM-dependent methyltransferase [Virgibacillus halotolerans]MBM7600208.1 putative AdoMet-dependent methyltransferase [Virgibacillus halotolerans]